MCIVPILGVITSIFVSFSEVLTEWTDERRAKKKKKKKSASKRKQGKDPMAEWRFIIYGE